MNAEHSCNVLLAPFEAVTKGLYHYAADWRAQTGRKVIGCIPMYVPEELIHAAGMLPVSLLGGDEEISLSDSYVQPYISCGLVRSNLDLALKGKLDFLDGVVFPDICDVTERVAEIWRLHVALPFHHNFMLPLFLRSPRAKGYLVEECRRLARALEGFGAKITEESLRRSIGIYNENRRLLAHLYELRQQPSFPLKSSNVAEVVLASMLMLKEEHNKHLQLLLSALQSLPQEASVSSDAPRVVVCGYTCDRPERHVLDFLESLGVRVVDDDLYAGRRYFHQLVSETGDAFDALAARHLAGLPCVTKYAEVPWAEFVPALAKEVNADGVLIVAPKYCDPTSFEFPHLKQLLDAEGLPYLMIEVEERGSGSAMIRNRLQAFAELVLERAGQ